MDGDDKLRMEEISEQMVVECGNLGFEKTSIFKIRWKEVPTYAVIDIEKNPLSLSLQLKETGDYKIITTPESSDIRISDLISTNLEWSIIPKKVKFDLVFKFKISHKLARRFVEQPWTVLHPCKVRDATRALFLICGRWLMRFQIVGAIVGFLLNTAWSCIANLFISKGK